MTLHRRHAEVVGAGFGGLVAAIALADRGFTVRLHERRPSLRGEGYGIAIHRNMACIFAAFGVLEKILTGGKKIDRRDSLDRHGHVVLSQKTARSAYRVDRQHVIAVLAERARKAGVEIALNSQVERAWPDGRIELRDRTIHTADLVVGADGVNSQIRDSLGLLGHRVMEPDGAVRVTIPRTTEEKAADAVSGTAMIEAWADKRRLLYCPVTDDAYYVLLGCATADTAGRVTPLDVEVWAASFPTQRFLLERVCHDADWAQARWVQFQTIRLKRWSAGRVAILGDAAHAMSPYLAQGAGHAMMNALALGVAVSEIGDIAQALDAWERRERPLTEHTQRWTRIYGYTMLLPETLKQLVIRAEKRLPWIGRQYVRAANHVPTGTAALTTEF
jgi:2-polyprenyl-6-methoxyphenol hydroxylase-like FAD-dependent oxidoreductase